MHRKLAFRVIEDNAFGDRLKGRGVKFFGEPATGPWGTRVLLEDLYGNRIFLSQEA